MPSLGNILKEERLKQGKNIKEIEIVTKIRGKYLLAIENDNFDALPGATYTRAFIRSYAKALDIESSPLIEEFVKIYQKPTLPAEESRTEYSTKNIYPSSRMGYSTTRRKKPNYSLRQVMAAIAVLFVFMFAYSSLKSMWTPAKEIKVSSGLASKKESIPKKNNAKPVAQNKTKKITLLAKISSPGSWVRVVCDNKEEFEGILQDGSQRSFSGSKIVLRAGNAGAVQVWKNDKSLGKIGNAGEVVEKTFK